MPTRQSLPWLLLAIAAAAFAAGILSVPENRGLFDNSDLLMPAAFAQDLLHRPGVIGAFQWPRIPSLFPDMLLVAGLTAALPSWRVATFAYAALQFSATVLACGLIAARLGGVRPAPAVLTLLSLSVAAILLDLQLDAGEGAWMKALSPVIHAGSLVAALAGVLLAWRYLAAPRAGLALGLGLLVTACVFSDRIFIGVFVGPVIVGALATLLPLRGGPARPSGRTVAVLCGVVLAGAAAGTALDAFLFRFVMMRDPDVAIDIAKQASRMPALMADPMVWFTACSAALVILLPAPWLLRSREGRYWWVVGAGMASGGLVLLPLVYQDHASVRYVQPTWWWLLIVLGAGALRLQPRLVPAGAAATALLGLVTVSYVRGDLFRPSVAMQWRVPVERCLTPLHQAGAIHDGIAGYWTARAVEATSDWALQVAQVTDKGAVLRWQNNLVSYGQSRRQPSQPPTFDYVVTEGLDTAAIAARFGMPDRVVPCGKTEVWIYADAGRFRAAIGGGSRIGRDGLLDEPLWISPSDFQTRTGSPGPDGTVPPSEAPGRAIATWGPYIGLRNGPWRMTLHYSLADAAPEDALWDIYLGPNSGLAAQGTLQEGRRQTKVSPFDVPRGATALEVRTYLPGGIRLQVHGVSLCPATASDDACAGVRPADAAASQPPR